MLQGLFSFLCRALVPIILESFSFVFVFNNNNNRGNGNSEQRIIRMVEAQVDPMEPAKFKTKRIPKGPPEAPVPILHSPPRKLTAVDQNAWKIPPCVSNWKNSKGYTIPLDKRLAADGRGWWSMFVCLLMLIVVLMWLLC
jgi:hypothetical protein